MGAPQLNIRTPKTTRLVRELAKMTGETQTEVVRKALREPNSNARRRSVLPATPAPPKRTAASSRKCGAKIKKNPRRRSPSARRMAENMLTDDDLYDENGLPRVKHADTVVVDASVFVAIFKNEPDSMNPDRARHVF